MILTIKDLVVQSLIPVDEYGDEIGVAYEVNTDTKIAKCLALLLRDHPEPSEVINPVNERHASSCGPAPDYILNADWFADFQDTTAKWQGANLPVFYRFEKLVPHYCVEENGWWGSRYEAIKEREARNNLPVVVREHLGFHNPKTVIGG